MEKTSEFLTKLQIEEMDLEQKKVELRKKQEFYNRCQRFDGEERMDILNCIVSIISEVEEKEYVISTFSKKEEDYYETRWRSYLEDVPNVSGAELAATAKPYSVLVSGAQFGVTLIIDKEFCDIFNVFDFSNCEDYERNLSKFLLKRKYVNFNRDGIVPEAFREYFPYISEFLERVINWRLEHCSLEVPQEVLESLKETKELTEKKDCQLTKKNII